MLSGDAGQSADGVGIDADQAPGGSDAAALVEVLEHGEGLLLGEMAVEQDCALALGEAVFAGVAVELHFPGTGSSHATILTSRSNR
jgi:hypothetical protein